MMGIDQRLIQGGLVLLMSGALAASWQLGFRRSVDATVQDERKASTLAAQISQWQAVFDASGGQAAWHANAQQHLAQLKAKFPKQAQLPMTLNALVDALKADDLKLLNVGRGNLEPVQEGQSPLLIDGLRCYRLPMTVAAEGRYHAVRQAIERVTADTFPGLVSVGRVEFRVKDATTATLDATLQLFLYVIGEAAEPSPHV